MLKNLLPENFTWRRGLMIGALVVFGAVLIYAAVSDGTWRAAAYLTVATFACLIALAIYFWGTILLGGMFEWLARRERSPRWSVESIPGLDVPEHDIDPGLELQAAGILVYRIGEVKPQIYFRKVPVANARCIRPFVVARTGAERPYPFEFMLTDDADVTRFEDTFNFPLRDNPQMVMPRVRLALSMPRKVVGQRWHLRVRSGVTTVTSFRFMFIDAPGSQGTDASGEHMVGEQQELLQQMLTEALKQDAMTRTQEIVLEDL